MIEELKDNNRHIMSYGGERDGPSLIVLAGIHGNEPAGIHALSLVKKMLEVEPITNPNFTFFGEIIGLIGNQAACDAGLRFIDQDLNRIWDPTLFHALQNTLQEKWSSEEREFMELITTIKQYISERQPQKLYILDLHTTSSDGGIFAIPNGDPESVDIASKLYTPVILDIVKGIEGTTLHFFTRNTFADLDTVALTFEGGQHEDPISVNRCIAAIVNCLRSIGCVSSEDVENIHDQILIDYSKDLPKVSRLIYKHKITSEDRFVMMPGYKNFDDIVEGEELAHDKNGPVLSPHSGKILMPLYQSKGEEGFYIIEARD